MLLDRGASKADISGKASGGERPASPPLNGEPTAEDRTFHLRGVPDLCFAQVGVPITHETENIMEDRTIPRQTIRVTVTLSGSRNLAGELHIDLDSRLSDFMNAPERFIAIKDKNGTLRIINKEHIVEIMEL